MLPALLVALASSALSASAASAVSIKEFPASVGTGAITAGPDGNVWFTGPGSIERVSPSGTITTFSEGLNKGSMPFDITEGPGGDLWFTDNGTTKAIGRITPSGAITEFTEKVNPAGSPQNIVIAPGGDVWFLDPVTPAIGHVSPSGAVTEYSSGIEAGSQLNDLAAGPGGDVWFTDKGNTKAIGRVTPEGEIKEFKTSNQISDRPSELTAGSDGNIWYTDEGSTPLGRVTPLGVITGYTTGLQAGASPNAPTLGPDGNVWFVDQYSGQRAVGRVTPSGQISEFVKGLSTGVPDAITVGADGNLWIEQSVPGSIARITPAGAITEFTAGFDPKGGADGDQILSGPDGNLWFTDLGEPKAIGRVALELPLAPAPVTPILTPRPPISAPLLRYKVTIATLGNQKITLSTPPLSVCTAAGAALPVTLSSTSIPRSHATKLRFAGATLYIDRGVKRRHRQTRLVHGRRRTVFVTVYTANATVRHSPASVTLRLTRLRSGAHVLKATLSYKRTVLRHHHGRIVTVKKTLSTQFRVC